MSAQSATISTSNATSLARAFSIGLPLPPAFDPRFEEALRHVLDHPGSLVRPRMVLLVASAYGVEDAAAQELAIALEYFHTASLIFDDLPCMDNAMERRGAPCVHFEFGEAEAILSALALINRAYALIWRAVATAPPESQQPAMAYIERLLGVHGLLNGQSLDLHYATMPHNLRDDGENCARQNRFPDPAHPGPAGDAGRRFGAGIQLLESIALYWGLAYQIDR